MITLRHGDRSQAVRDLQRKLNAKGAKLATDGDYGDATEDAVRAYQLKAGLVSDGVAGPKTQASLMGLDVRKLLKHSDLVKASQRLGVPVAAVYALNEVESQGCGFFDNGKPVILFERHVMYERLQVARDPADDQEQLNLRAAELAQQVPNLVSPKAGGYIGGTAEHQRLAQASQFDEQAALESASWGGFQVMGYHWKDSATPASRLCDGHETQRSGPAGRLRAIHRDRPGAAQGAQSVEMGDGGQALQRPQLPAKPVRREASAFLRAPPGPCTRSGAA